MTKYQIFSPNGLKICIIEASSIVHTPEFSVLYGKWLPEINRIEPICTLFKGYLAVPLDNLTDDYFTIRLKELCLKYDKEHGKFPDVDLVGASLYDFYCFESGLNLDYPDQRHYEYIESDEPINISDIVCFLENPSYRGIVFGIEGDNIYVDFPKSVVVVYRSHLKKVIRKEII